MKSGENENDALAKDKAEVKSILQKMESSNKELEKIFGSSGAVQKEQRSIKQAEEMVDSPYANEKFVGSILKELRYLQNPNECTQRPLSKLINGWKGLLESIKTQDFLQSRANSSSQEPKANSAEDIKKAAEQKLQNIEKLTLSEENRNAIPKIAAMLDTEKDTKILDMAYGGLDKFFSSRAAYSEARMLKNHDKFLAELVTKIQSVQVADFEQELNKVLQPLAKEALNKVKTSNSSEEDLGSWVNRSSKKAQQNKDKTQNGRGI